MPLHPIATAIPSIAGLVDLMNGIESYVTPRDGHPPDNAAVIYLVLALAFEQAGIASVSSFPTIRVGLGSEEAEVSCHSKPFAPEAYAQ